MVSPESVSSDAMHRDIVLTVIGLVAGWAISHFSYAKSIKGMKVEAEERKRVEQLLLRGVGSIGTIRYNRDGVGNINGVVIDLKANIRQEPRQPTSLST